MADQVSTPGVYVQTSTGPQPPTSGAATSIAAFVGRTPIGPVNVATPLLGYADYARKFGGLSSDSAISYQVNAFFNNGGEQGVVVRLYRPPTETSVCVEGKPAEGYAYAIGFELDGAAIQARYTATAKDTATTVAAKLAAAITADAKLATIVTATIDATHDASIDIQLVPKPPLHGGVPTLLGLASGTVTDGDGNPVPDTITKLLLGSTRTLGSGLGGAGAAAVVMRSQTPPTADASPLTFAAANGGSWGNALSVTLTPVPSAASSTYAQYGLDGSATQLLFDLDITYVDAAGTHHSERFTNVTFAGGDSQPNRIDKVLADGSLYLRYTNIPAHQGSDGPALSATAVMVGTGAGGIDSVPLQVSDYTGDADSKTGLYALNQEPYGFNILCVPADAVDDPSVDQDPAVYQTAAQICLDNNAMLICDPPNRWLKAWETNDLGTIAITDLGSFTADQARSSAVYFPGVVISDPLANGQPKSLPPCGFMAAIWATIDAAQGVWKAPAGIEFPIGGIVGLQAKLTDTQNGVLNPQGINALRSFNQGGDVVWGARTLRGADLLADQYKYIPVRRLSLYIETSLIQDTQWAVFEPNAPALWAALQQQVTTFMSGLFSLGAFAGTSASQAFFVTCDSTTTTPIDQANGIVNVNVGFAPTYPAEFVVVTISQRTATGGS